MKLFKVVATIVLLLANILLLNPREINYDWLVTSFVVLVWIGFIGIIWGEELKSITDKVKKNK